MPSSLLNYYEAIEEASAEMLRAARKSEWDQVVRLESACAILIAQLRQHAKNAELEREELQEKSKIMQRILRNDAQIRFLTEPWLQDLESLLHQEKASVH
jgi:flagellar protein FliT